MASANSRVDIVFPVPKSFIKIYPERKMCARKIATNPSTFPYFFSFIVPSTRLGREDWGMRRAISR